MNKFDRIYDLYNIFKSHRYPIPLSSLNRDLECSPPTVKRLIAKLRHELGIPIRYSKKYNGYFLAVHENRQHELPGLWFSSSELQAMVIIHELITRLEPGLLRSAMGPFRERIDKILKADHIDNIEPARRFRIFGIGVRTCLPRHFRIVASATLQRMRLDISYHNRSDDNRSRRTISPQRIIYYRDNWYLNAWCHMRKDFRTFALDRIKSARILTEAAREIPDEALDEHYSPSFGIFGGPADQKAVLRFTPGRARWIADEKWHPNQQGVLLDDGSYELTLPFSDSRELILDILRYGPDVEVLEPESLRKEVRERLKQALERYEEG